MPTIFAGKNDGNRTSGEKSRREEKERERRRVELEKGKREGKKVVEIQSVRERERRQGGDR